MMGGVHNGAIGRRISFLPPSSWVFTHRVHTRAWLSTTWLTHTAVYETKGDSTLQWLFVAFYWVRRRVRIYIYINIIQRVCQPFCRKSGEVPSAWQGLFHAQK